MKLNDFEKINKAKFFALGRHKDQFKIDKETSFSNHLEGVVSRLKNLGITDPDVICAAWLHDVLEHTETDFDELNQIFDNKISVIVLSLSKNRKLSKKEQEIQYVKQLKEASFHAKIIKFCDVSTNLKEVLNSKISKSQKKKKIRKLVHYARVMVKDISDNKDKIPKIQEIVNFINLIAKQHHLKPLTLN